MQHQSNMRFIQNLLYKLKRQFGANTTLYKTIASDVDPRTGQRTTLRRSTKIKLAIVLPDALANKFAYEHSFLAANRKFTYGSQWDQRQRLVVIDGRDLPKDWLIGLEDSLVFNNLRYVINKAELLDQGYGYMLTVVRAENNLPLQILELSVLNRICLGQSVGAT